MTGIDYESARILSEYLLFHYGKGNEVLPWEGGPREFLDYAARIIAERFLPFEGKEPSRGLDVGCAVGRSTFEMARYCGSVLGIDYSKAFIQAAKKLKKDGSLPYRFVLEGDRAADFVAEVPADIDRSRVKFRKADAMELPDNLGDFDWVLAANLICRLPRPRRFLKRLRGLVRVGGVLVLNTPFTWMRDLTPRKHWIGGTHSAGESREVLAQVLAPYFELVDEKPMPFLLRETARKYQWTVAHSTRWRRVEA